MENNPQELTRPTILPIERVSAALEVILCSGFPTQIVIITVLNTFGMRSRLPNGLLSPPFVFTLTLLDTLLLVGLIVLFFRAHRESARAMLFGGRRTGRELLVGLAVIPASFIVVILVMAVVQLTVPTLHNILHNPLQDLVRNRREAYEFAFVVMIAGGVREEIQRGFVLRRFQQYLGGAWVGIVVFSLIFGLGHLEQGNDVAIATSVLGAFWGVIFVRRGSVAAPMVGHAGFNLAQVVKLVALR